MAFSIKWIYNGVTNDITDHIGNFTWTESLDQLGASFTFGGYRSAFDSNYQTIYAMGSLIILKDGKNELLRGIITTRPLHDDEYSGYDYAFYLNKSETIIQFKNVAADKAIKQLCKKFGVPVGSIAKMKTKIKKLYKDEIVSDIIKDILKKVKHETGTTHKIEMNKGKFTVIKTLATKITPTYVDATGQTILCADVAGITGTKSIEEMKNYVVYAGTSEKAKKIKATAKDSKTIKKYGLLMDVETEDGLTKAKARNKAKNALKSLDKVATNFTAEMPGNTIIKAGRLIYFDRPEADIKGWYAVQSCTHTIVNGKYTVSCEMKRA